MKRVKGVEDLNICIIGAQGIVGVGAIIRICTSLLPVAVLLSMVPVGFPPDLISFCPCVFSPVCSVACS